MKTSLIGPPIKSGRNVVSKKTHQRPWGSFEKLTYNVRSTVKIITVEPHSKLSLQYHKHRDEFWKVINGECIVVVNGGSFKAKKGDDFYIPRKIRHRISTSTSRVEILEISLGKFSECDIVRIEDEYGRAISA